MSETIAIDAEIRNAYIETWGDARVVIGEIYNDAKARFRDGYTIHTSRIVEELPGGIYRTKNSTYKVIFKPAAPRVDIPNVDETPEPELRWFKVVVLKDAYINYETMVQARSREEARDLVDTFDYDGKLVEVGTSEYDERVVEVDNIAEATAEEVAEFEADTGTKLIVATAENGDPGPEDTVVISDRARDTILAALHHWREFFTIVEPRLFEDNTNLLVGIATNAGLHEPLTYDEVDKLMEKLNQ